MLAGLVALVLLLATPLASAHVPSTGPGVVPSLVLIADEAPHDPRCHHGQGGHPVGGALLRLEQQDLEPEPSSLTVVGPVTAPCVAVVSGLPRVRPDPAPVPVYLLTRRLRS